MWYQIINAPFDEDLQLAVIEGGFTNVSAIEN
jgi:hypothetical protein